MHYLTPLLWLPLLLLTHTALGSMGASCSCDRGSHISNCYYAGGSFFYSCKQCPTGYYNGDNFYCGTSYSCKSKRSENGGEWPTCTSCAAGKYNPNTQSIHPTDCKDCDYGQWSLDGSKDCDKCTAGRGKGSSGTTCKACAVGKYQNQKTKTQCKGCPIGKTTHNNDDDGTGKASATNCIGCELGTIVTAPSPNVICTTCAAGQYRATYSSVVGDMCTRCLVGTFITDNHTDPLFHDQASDCQQCPAGFQYDTPAGCAICEGGTYQDQNSVDAVTCQKCPMNTFLADDKGEGVAHDALNDCMNCPLGKFSSTGQRFCERCQAGQIQHGTTSSCIDCAIGYYSTGNVDTCIPCLKGKYQSESGTAYCLPCLPGASQALTGQSRCPLCSNGRYQNSSQGEVCHQCPLGYIGDDGSHTRCNPCTEGRAGGACDQCASGTYRSARDNSEKCLACPSGWSQNGMGSSTCYRCVPGEYNDKKGQASCKKCPIGFYQDVATQEKCTGCKPGTYQSKQKQASCVECVPGKFQNITGQQSCQECPEDQLTNASGSVECHACGNGKFSKVGSARCTTCVAGKAGTPCLDCVVGKYKEGNSNDPTRCDNCPRGYYQSKIGQGSCLSCSPGQHQDQPAQAECKACAAGTAMASSTSFVVDCPNCKIGKFVAAPGQSSCVPCPAGKWSDVSGLISDAQCALCGGGRYSSALGAIHNRTCVLCSAGKYGTDIGATTADVCQHCQVGHYRTSEMTSALECIACSNGTYQNSVGQATCLPCIQGEYNAQSGQTGCTKCPIGFYQDVSNQDQCIGCKPGTYQPKQKQALCIECVPGKHQSIVKMSTCDDCAPNTFANVSGLSKCYDCSFDSPLSTTGSAVCSSCPVGTQSQGKGTCIECASGLFRNEDTHSVQCSSCPHGFYQQETGASSCLPCVPGTFNNNVGAIECQDCLSGQYSNVSVSTKCSTCSIGQHSIQGSARCEKCSAGYAGSVCSICLKGQYRSGAMAATSCVECPQGWHQPDAGSASCVPCNLGTSQILVGQAQCTNCPSGTYANRSQMSVCIYCESGKTQTRPGSASCLSCSAGEYGDSCDKCSEGKYRRGDAIDASVCKSCFPGFHQNARGSAACLPCIPGKYSDVLGLAACKSCPPGKIQEDVEGTLCLAAPSGTVANGGGSSTYTIAKGWHATKCNAVSLICQDSAPCEKGTIGEWPATSKCLACPAGFSSYRGSLACIDCEPGKFAATQGAESCQLCSEYMYQPIPAQKECLKCGVYERGDSARIKCEEARTPTPDMQPPNRPVATVASHTTVTFEWDSVLGGGEERGGTFVPSEIVVEWCANDMFKQDETNVTVVSASTVRITVPSQNHGQISPTNGGILVRLTSRNQNYRSKIYSPISALWKLSEDCRGSYLDTSVLESPWSWNCTQCPSGANCKGKYITGDMVTAQEGWWRLSDVTSSPNYVRFAQCLIPAACKGAGPRDEATGMKGEQCNTQLGFRQWCNDSSIVSGTSGESGERCRLCAACLPNYQHLFGREACAPCPGEGDTVTQVAILLLTMFVFFGLFTVLVYCRAKGRGRKSVSSGVRKIIINFLQVTSLFVAWSVPWPDSVTWMLVAEGFSSSISDATISLTCSMPTSTAFAVMQTGQIFWAMSPFVMILGMTVVYGSAVVFCCPNRCGNGTKRLMNMGIMELWRKRRKTFQSPKDNWVMACLYTLYLMYPALTACSFSLLRCLEIDGILYLRGDLQVECYSWQGHGHMWWVMGLSVPCLILFVFFIPIGGILTLWTHRDSLYDRSHPKHRWAMVRYGLLYDGYREGAWWFELVVAIRKAGFVAMSMLTEGRLQVQIAVGFLALMLALNICLHPYGLGTGAHAVLDVLDVNAPVLVGVGTNESKSASPPSRLSALRGERRDSTTSLSSSLSRQSSAMGKMAKETPEEKVIRLKQDKYDHTILHRMDLVSLLTSLTLAWSGMLFILANDDRAEASANGGAPQYTTTTTTTTETVDGKDVTTTTEKLVPVGNQHSVAEEMLGAVVVLLNVILLVWAAYAFVTRWVKEHDRHITTAKQTLMKLGRKSVVSTKYSNPMRRSRKSTAPAVFKTTRGGGGGGGGGSREENSEENTGEETGEEHFNEETGNSFGMFSYFGRHRRSSTIGKKKKQHKSLSHQREGSNTDEEIDWQVKIEMTSNSIQPKNVNSSTNSKSSTQVENKKKKHRRHTSVELTQHKSSAAIALYKDPSVRTDTTLKRSNHSRERSLNALKLATALQQDTDPKKKKDPQLLQLRDKKDEEDTTMHTTTFNPINNELSMAINTMQEEHGKDVHRDPESGNFYRYNPDTGVSEWLP